MILDAPNSHLYPGLRGSVSGPMPDIGDASATSCMVVFSDGCTTHATLSRNGQAYRLCTEPYRTAAGTDITAKTWSVVFEQDQDHGLRFRVTGRPEPAPPEHGAKDRDPGITRAG